ncbi:MAG: hypothetical protein ACT4PL_03250, partial [Phycisphaerales bacterium]
RATAVHIGRLPLPVALLLADSDPAALSRATRLPRSVENLRELPALRRVLRGEVPLLREPVVQLGDGRVVRLRAMDARDNRLLLSCITEQLARPSAPRRSEPAQR